MSLFAGVGLNAEAKKRLLDRFQAPQSKRPRSAAPSVISVAPSLPPRPPPEQRQKADLLTQMRDEMEAAALRLTPWKSYDGAFHVPLEELRSLIRKDTQEPYPPHAINLPTIQERISARYTSPYEMLADVALLSNNVLSFAVDEVYLKWARTMRSRMADYADQINERLGEEELRAGEAAERLRKAAGERLQSHPLAEEFQELPLLRRPKAHQAQAMLQQQQQQLAKEAEQEAEKPAPPPLPGWSAPPSS
eukprot:Hpha_TRINITY_DN15164_c1_g2::TRINITY_DN15164_c1_g2_i1::g.129281::m.129281